MRHLLVTNDFPPKVGGIQSYLWELWRRLPPEETTVLTTPYKGATTWDASQPFRVERTREPVLLPTRGLARRIDALASEVDAEIVLLDPALPLGFIGPSLERPYGVVLHGAEVTVPGRLPVSRWAMKRVLVDARFVVAAGGYPLAEGERAAGRALPGVVIPPGVDVDRFRPLDMVGVAATRERFGLNPGSELVISISRLVPRKGMDVLIRAVAELGRDRAGLQLAIVGGGRDRTRLERLVTRLQAPVTFLGRVDDSDLAPLYGCADVFAMLCRNRWMGLEQEGFGIVFLESAACGVPQLAGRSGGSAEAVDDGVTGLVVDDPRSIPSVVRKLERLLDDPDERRTMGVASRARVTDGFTYDHLAAKLDSALSDRIGGQ